MFELSSSTRFVGPMFPRIATHLHTPPKDLLFQPSPSYVSVEASTRGPFPLHHNTPFIRNRVDHCKPSKKPKKPTLLHSTPENSPQASLSPQPQNAVPPNYRSINLGIRPCRLGGIIPAEWLWSRSLRTRDTRHRVHTMQDPRHVFLATTWVREI